MWSKNWREKKSYKIAAHSFQKTYTYMKLKYQIHSTAAHAPKAPPYKHLLFIRTHKTNNRWRYTNLNCHG
jgi:hypothetical protein